MTLLLTNARLIDPEALTETTGSLLIENGQIAGDRRRRRARRARQSSTASGKCLAPGIVDLGVKIGEPGERHKECFRSAGLAAAAGGVTTIIARPDTSAGHRHPRGARIRHPPRRRGLRRSASATWPR